MSPKEPTPDSDADDGEAKDDAVEVVAGERQPPGPGDVPLSNLPPPAAEEAAAEAVPGDAESEAPAEADAPAGDAPAEAPDVDDDSTQPVAVVVGEAAETTAEAAPEAPAEATEPEADAEEPDGAAEPEPEPARSGRPAPITYTATPHARSRLTAIAVVVAILAAFLALAKAQQVGDLQSDLGDRKDVERVARDFGAAYLSLDYEHVADSAKAVEALSTPAFAESYAAQSVEIQQLATSRQSSTTATAKEVFVGAITDDAARALVVVDVTSTSPGVGEQRLDDVSFTVDLTRTSKGWRVAKATRPVQPSLPTTTTTVGAPPP